MGQQTTKLNRSIDQSYPTLVPPWLAQRLGHVISVKILSQENKRIEGRKETVSFLCQKQTNKQTNKKM